MAPHSSTLAWRIPWMEKPGGLQSMRSLGVRHDWATSLSCIGEGNGNPLQCSCLENPRDEGAWWAAVYGVTQSRTRLSHFPFLSFFYIYTGFPGGAGGKESTCQWRRHKKCEFDPWVEKILWRRAWQPTLVVLLGEPHGHRSLVGYSPWGCKELDMTEAT